MSRATVGAVLGLLVLACAPEQAARAERDARVYRVPVTGTIELGLAPFIERSLAEAEAMGAAAVVLDIETPGGRVDAAQRIVNTVSEAAVPVYALVNRRAFSAGAMIALAADRVYMVPGSVMGAATPVTGEGQKAPEKIVSAMRSEMRALAEARGLDPRVAEAMVDESIAIDGVVEEGKLLTLTADEAVALDYAEPIEGWEALLATLELDDALVVATETNWAEGLVRFITNPIVAPLLLSLGFLGLLVEIKTPTFGLAGAAGIVSLGLFFGGHYLVGLAGMEEFIILGAAMVALAVEAFVVPGFGVFGILGIAGLAVGIYMSLVSQLSTMADYSQAAGMLSAAVIVVLVAGWALLRYLPTSRSFLRSGIFLGESTKREGGYLSAAVRSELIGMEGVALTDLRPAGVGRFGDERVDVVAEEGWLEAGTAIEVLRAEGYRHVVRALNPEDIKEPGDVPDAGDETQDEGENGPDAR